MIWQLVEAFLVGLLCWVLFRGYARTIAHHNHRETERQTWKRIYDEIERKPRW